MARRERIRIGAVDATALYTERERALDERLRRAVRDRVRHERARRVVRACAAGRRGERQALAQLERIYGYAVFLLPEEGELAVAIAACRAEAAAQRRALRAALLAHAGPRSLAPERARAGDGASLPASALTRQLGLRPGARTGALLLVRAARPEALFSLARHGFTVGGARYVALAAAPAPDALLFLRETLFRRHEKALLGGLTRARIRALAGRRADPRAPLPACAAATEPWPAFDIGRAIVVDDVPAPAGGAAPFGLVLPQVSGGAAVHVRLPWIEGRLEPFPFDAFLRARGPAGCTVRDIYGKAHDVLAEGVQVIFTRSQFRLWRCYACWAEYRLYFRAYGCEAERRAAPAGACAAGGADARAFCERLFGARRARRRAGRPGAGGAAQSDGE